MKKLLLLLFIPLFSIAQRDQVIINTVLDDWHKAAATVNFEAYFGAMTEDAIFIGTDATEN